MMDISEAIESRHSVRQYSDRPIGQSELDALRAEIAECNRLSGLNIQLVCDEPKAFSSFLAHYGKFSGVNNYIALVGKKDGELYEKCGYYGERLVIKAQQLGLNTCWVALTFGKVKNAYTVGKGEKLALVIALGYGATQGKPHRSKALEDVAQCQGEMPDWFRRGAECALLAPTALNQQKFTFLLQGDKVVARHGSGSCVKVDLGIVKYHFEVGSGKGPDIWANE